MFLAAYACFALALIITVAAVVVALALDARYPDGVR